MNVLALSINYLHPLCDNISLQQAVSLTGPAHLVSVYHSPLIAVTSVSREEEMKGNTGSYYASKRLNGP